MLSYGAKMPKSLGKKHRFHRRSSQILISFFDVSLDYLRSGSPELQLQLATGRRGAGLLVGKRVQEVWEKKRKKGNKIRHAQHNIIITK